MSKKTTRNLYLKNTPLGDAKEKYLKALKEKKPWASRRSTEGVETKNSLYRITAEPIYAKYNSPLYDSAAMDGIAVISGATVGASETNPIRLSPEKDFVPVDTGDPIRPPYDAVIMAEDLLEVDSKKVEIRMAASAWQHVRPIGEDIVQGEMILPRGHTIRPMDIGVLLSAGIVRVEVSVPPKVAVIPTGTEMIEPEDTPKDGDIIESNSRMLTALVSEDGGAPTRFAPVADDYEELKRVVSEAVSEHDFVLINAGSSAGREDYTVSILRELGEVVIHGVAIKPGKPVILAIVQGKPVIGIPGYPVSAYLAYKQFATEIIAAFTGAASENSTTVEATISRRIISSLKYKEYVRVKVGEVDNRLIASPLARGAGAAMSLVRSDGFCVVDQNLEGYEAGSKVQIELMKPLEELRQTVVVIGSHDLILDLINDLLAASYPGVSLSSTHVGSMAGLMALKNHETHIAPIHLLDGNSGKYNVPILNELFPGENISLIKGVGRMQGILLKKGNPLGIKGIKDLVNVRYINRQRGAGTRILFDYILKESGIAEEEISGYDREVATHMAVAAAVKSENADAGLGILSAAKAMDLDFIEVGKEEYDFAIRSDYLDLPHIKDFIKVLRSNEFTKELEKLGGYTFDECGNIRGLGDV